MDPFLKKLLGEMLLPAPEDVNAYFGDQIAIFIPKVNIYLESTHVHGGYQFLVPLTTSFPFQVEKKTIILEQNKFFPFNPEQIHRAANRNMDLRFLAIFIDKEYLHETSNSVYGQRNILFENSNIELDANTQNLIRMFIEESRNCQAGHDFILQSLSLNITINLLRQVKSNLPSVTGRRYTENQSIHKAVDFLWECYKEDFSLHDVARVANLSANQLIRSFKQETGKTPFDYLLDIKIQRAKEMLRLKQRTVTEICYACGFNNLSHFTTVFKRKVGVSPSKYRQFILGIL
ncbi:Helix-turn-helix domain-containing protein [Desulfotomaculum arcticum]|uniref:Helix-turn-helix domain-containing protein n=1 Tax=Desulfotruncus arcticus DSM 17038 TaxID=1121424 RepID=A0A1I2WGA4_9FIRM|nr:helix-turn-helix domain-containing protein [Desulfotruncus arcticus]SFH00372.1 Helix-turn-helix domain-containing protein [Desulfotomaculum arcticum] [Desulfotruncus arcticus DSM 17038]